VVTWEVPNSTVLNKRPQREPTKERPKWHPKSGKMGWRRKRKSSEGKVTGKKGGANSKHGSRFWRGGGESWTVDVHAVSL